MTRSGLSDVQALVFDTYGTVVDWRAGVLDALRALGRSRGLTVDWDAFLGDWQQTRSILDRVNRGELPPPAPMFDAPLDPARSPGWSS